MVVNRNRSVSKMLGSPIFANGISPIHDPSSWFYKGFSTSRIGNPGKLLPKIYRYKVILMLALQPKMVLRYRFLGLVFRFSFIISFIGAIAYSSETDDRPAYPCKELLYIFKPLFRPKENTSERKDSPLLPFRGKDKIKTLKRLHYVVKGA